MRICDYVGLLNSNVCMAVKTLLLHEEATHARAEIVPAFPGKPAFRPRPLQLACIDPCCDYLCTSHLRLYINAGRKHGQQSMLVFPQKLYMYFKGSEHLHCKYCWACEITVRNDQMQKPADLPRHALRDIAAVSRNNEVCHESGRMSLHGHEKVFYSPRILCKCIWFPHIIQGIPPCRATKSHGYPQGSYVELKPRTNKPLATLVHLVHDFVGSLSLESCSKIYVAQA
jgi:hypothetical protein